MEQQKKSVIRTIYLYLFALVGLTLLIIGCVGFVNMALKVFVFTQADAEQEFYNTQPPTPYGIEGIKCLNNTNISNDQKLGLEQWLNDYKLWQEKQKTFDYVTTKRHKDAARNLAFIIIGLPLFLYHWSIIRRETKNRN